MVASGEEDQNVEGHSEVQRRDMPYDILLLITINYCLWDNYLNYI